MNQSFWTLNGTGCLNEGVMAYDNSCTNDPKRPHQLIVDGSEVGLVPNKKQAIEVSNNIDNNNNNNDNNIDNNNNNDNNVYLGMLNSSVPQWVTSPGFHTYPSQLSERSYASDSTKNVGFDDRSFAPIGAEKINLGSKAGESSFGSVSTFDLSAPHTLEDPRSSFCFGDGFKKIRVSEVKDSESLLSGPIAHTYNGVNNNPVSIGLSYDKGDENIVRIGNTYENTDNDAISHTMSAGSDTLYLDRSYKAVESNNISGGLIYNNAPESCSITTSSGFNTGDGGVIPMMGHSYNQGESTIISFGGGYNDDDDYDELLAGLTPTLNKETANDKEFVSTYSGKNLSKKRDDNKVSKKAPSNNFPPNVRSLLSTGILDGVPVKYIAWSREKQLPGVIKGSGYLCGCQSCNYSEVINAYEFERHACCKTKHPNNHIYFENGKTIYGAVQELKSTPQNLLLDAIQTVAGSPINQESFRLWKVSFLAATRELKRIYGTEQVKQSF